MPADLTAMKPIALCRLMNSTPLGEVLTEQRLRNHRTRAGLRIGPGSTVHVLKYIGWLLAERYLPDAPDVGGPTDPTAESTFDAVLSVIAAGSSAALKPKHERAIAALLTEPSYAAAARKVGIATSTLYRWLDRPKFRAAFDAARDSLVRTAMSRLQAASLIAVDAIQEIARRSPRDGDRLRAAQSILTWGHTELSRDRPARSSRGTKVTPAEVVTHLGERLRTLDASDLSQHEKSRLTPPLAGALLRAIEIDTLNQRLTAMETVLKNRKESP